MFTDVPGTRAAMRAAIYWMHEVRRASRMTKQPGLLKIGELAGQVEHPARRQGPGVAPQADSELPGRLQANPQLRHLLPRDRQPQDPGDHRAHRRG